ncbi:hypothetical protein DM01DRAFT_1387187 [Hesseltinella vesiculosa]|uniref:DNA polymerase delta subunit 3 n=1 Tax=Hesseltinella vesiculosa TaxID=101127 RepID=A0A1X2G2Y7_9FUNG|nr:hypothetical protein DM01DRAFT_1387187 [Hesseltinella vesiculosa]
MAEIISYLDTTIQHEKKTITFKGLSRAMNLHVNVAKQALYDYAASHQDLTAVYSVSGSLENKSFLVKLSTANDLNDTKHLFQKVLGVHVYCILPNMPKDAAPLVQANHDLANASIDDRFEQGMIRNKAITLRSKSTVKAAPPASTPPTTSQPAPKPVSNPVLNKASKTTSPASAKPITQTKATAKATTPAKRKATLTFDGHKAKKQAVQEKVNDDKPTTSRKVRTIQESDEEEEEEDEESLDARLARSATLQNNDDFFSDDEDDVKDHDMNDAQPKSPEPAAQPSSPVETTELSETTSAPGVRRRKIQRKKTYKNEQGYLVTEMVSDWEEVPEEDVPSTSAKPVQKPAPAPTSKKSSGSKKTNTEQRSLLSFWGKR